MEHHSYIDIPVPEQPCPQDPGTDESVVLAPYTTMRVGGPARYFCITRDRDELIDAVLASDAEGDDVFVLGGGSNVLIGDDGFDGHVIHPADTSITTLEGPGDTVLVSASAGTPWDSLVDYCVDEHLAGLEALSGIPGTIGSAVMQNLGAYGQEAAQTLSEALLLDRETREVRAWCAADLDLGYRTSMLRASLEAASDKGAQSTPRWYPTCRWVVLEATFELNPAHKARVGNSQLARALDVSADAELKLEEIRQAVLDVRASKGMLADPDPDGPDPIYDRWSTGSFFMNPVISEDDAARLLPADAPRYAAAVPGLVKTSAAWLIEHAGFPKGYGVHGAASRATLSDLHTLALTNRGSARASDIVELARTVQGGVEARFGIRLRPETVLVGVEL